MPRLANYKRRTEKIKICFLSSALLILLDMDIGWPNNEVIALLISAIHGFVED